MTQATASIPASIEASHSSPASSAPADSPAVPPVDNAEGTSAKLLRILVGAVLLVVAAIAGLIFQENESGENIYSGIVGFIAAIVLGLPLIYRAILDFAQGKQHLHQLAALAVAASIASNLYQTAGWIAFIMTLSDLIESRTAQGARTTIERLLRLTPTKATKINDDGTETIVEAANLQPGDIVRVRPGDNLPGDGVVVSGFSTVDQANITGESLPVDKTEGDEVFGGTSNQTGALDVKITAAGRDTTLGRVQDLVAEAQASKTSTQRLADAYASYHTPVVFMIALVVLFFTNDPRRAIALLVVATPSSIILVTPTAMVAALSAAARVGVLVKSVSVLERARNLSAIVLDKTGTLTTGKLSVTRIGPALDIQPAELLRAAVSVEQNSTHPVARAVREVAERARVTPQPVVDFEEVMGRGVTGRVGDDTILVGRENWLAEQGINTEMPEDKRPPEGFSLLWVARGGQLLGWVGLEDKVRPDAADAVDALRDQGVQQVVMVSGDRWSVANRVAAETHCTDVQAEVLPADKLKVVNGLKAKGHVVAVVGDGVNDAPALKAGDLSVAMGAAGSDIAISAAEVALMNNKLDRIPFLQRLAKTSGTVILQGIGISMAFILIFGGLAAAGKIDPIVAAALHALSSIVVVFNSARLVRQGEEMDATPVEETLEMRETITPAPVAAIA